MSLSPIANPAETRAERFAREMSTAHLSKNLHQRTVRGGMVTIAAQAARFVLQIGSTMILARLLTPGDFGLVAMVGTVTGFALIFKDAGLSMATVQRADVTHEQVSNLFWVNVALSAGLMLLLMACSPLVAWFYGPGELVWITVALSTAFLFGGLTVQHEALLTRQMKFKLLGIIGIGSMAFGVTLAVAMAMLGLNYWALVGLTVGQAAANCVLAWVFCKWRPGLLSRGAGTLSMLRFGGYLTAFNVLNYFTRNADNVMLGFAWGAGPLGIYSKAYGLLLLPLRQINAPIAAVAIPALSRLQDKPDEFRTFYRSMLRLIAYVTMPLVVVLGVLAEEVTLLVLGPNWGEAAPVFRVLAFFGVVQSVSSTTGWVLTALGRTRRMLEWNFIGTPVIVAAFAIGLSGGAYGVAMGATIGALVLVPPQVWYAFRGLAVRPRDVVVAASPPLLLAAGMFLAGEGTRRAIQAPIMSWITQQLSGSEQWARFSGAASAMTICLLVGALSGLMLVLWFALLPSARRELVQGYRMFRKRG